MTTLQSTSTLTMSVTLATSPEIRDRGSTFVGCIYRASSVEEARGVVRQQGQQPRRAASGTDKRDAETYTIAAWRCMVVKPGCTGLGGPDDFEVGEGWDDGGERWAGRRVLGVMQREGVVDAVVVVRRWFGGTLLGPVRFAHVETCAGEVCRRFKKVEEMDEYVQTLQTLDEVLASLRTRLASLREPSEDARPKRSTPDYRAMQQTLDLTKAKRLIHARECAINNTKTLIEKYNTST